MRETSHAHVFEHTPFPEAVLAFWNRYSSPLAAHVTSEDVLAREFHGNRLHTIRLVKKERRSFPKFLPGKLASIRETWIIERTILDASSGLLMSVSRNITHRPNADGIEWSTLETHERGTLSTSVFSIASKTASTSFAGPFVQGQIENAFAAGSKGAAEKSRKGFQIVLDVLGDPQLRHKFLYGQDPQRFARGTSFAPSMKHAEEELSGFSGHGLENREDRYAVVELKPARPTSPAWTLKWRTRENDMTPGGAPPRATPVRDYIRSWWRYAVERRKREEQAKIDADTLDRGS